MVEIDLLKVPEGSPGVLGAWQPTIIGLFLSAISVGDGR